MHQKLDECYRQLNRNRNITDALIELEELLEKVQPYIPQSAVYYKDEIDMLSLCNESMRSEGNKPDSVALLVQVDTVQEMQVEDTAGQVVQSYIRAFEKAEQLSVQPADTAVPSSLLTERTVRTWRCTLCNRIRKVWKLYQKPRRTRWLRNMKMRGRAAMSLRPYCSSSAGLLLPVIMSTVG